ncbi:MAG: response regulator [Acidobacteriota bacterium]
MTRRRLLLVDDEPVLRRSLADHLRLERPSIEVVTASSRDEALAALRTGAIDLVMSDVRMPGGDGFELLQRMRGEEIKAGVFLFSAYLTETQRQRAEALGALEVLDKPLDLDQLTAAIDRHLLQDEFGQQREVALRSFLELIETESKSCTFRARSGSIRGVLIFLRGELVYAEQGELSGDAAALRIIGWQHAEVTLDPAPSAATTNVSMALSRLLREAAPDASGSDSEGGQEAARDGEAVAEASLELRALFDRLEWLDGFVAAALLSSEFDPQKHLYTAGRIGGEKAHDVAARFARVLRLEDDLLRRAGSGQRADALAVRATPIHHFLYRIEKTELVLYAAVERSGSNQALVERSLQAIVAHCAAPAS